MPNSSQFSDELRSLLIGTPWGDVYPPKANPPALSVDGRTIALRILSLFISEIQMYLPGGIGMPPEQFHIGQGCIQLGWPDSEVEAALPGIVILGGRGTYEPIGLTSYLDESTVDKYQAGTVVQWQNEYVETLLVEIWAATKPQQRAILSALETAFMPTEQMSGIRFRMPDYFDQPVVFMLGAREIFDEPDSARGRRRARLELGMRFTIVSLVNSTNLRTTTQVSVDVDELGAPVEIEEGV